MNTTCALFASGEVQCLGPSARVGARIPDPATRFVSLEARHSTACGITKDRRVSCFGTCLEVPGSPCDAPAGEFDEVSVGNGGEVCALRRPHTVACWGFGTPWRNGPPVNVDLHGLRVGERYACALDDAGRVHCWGDRDPGLPPPPEGTGFREVATVRHHACALHEDGHVACFGLGAIAPPNLKYTQIAGNWEAFCGLDEGGTAVCFGRVKGIEQRGARHGHGLTQIAVGQNHGCGLDAHGALECWGEAPDYGEGPLPRHGIILPPPRERPAAPSVAGATDPVDTATRAPSLSGAARRNSNAGARSSRPRMPETPPSDGPLVVEIDGTPIPIAGAVAGTAGESAVRVVLGTHPLDCSAAGRGPRTRRDGEREVVLTLAKLFVEPDGRGGYEPGKNLRVSRASWSGARADVRGGGVALAGGIAALSSDVAKRGGRARVAIDYEGSFAVGAHKSTLRVRGATALLTCGATPPAGTPRAQPDLTLTVGGQAIAVHGATLVEDHGRTTLRLSSGPAVCPSTLFDAPWDFLITLRGTEKSRQLTVGGARFPNDIGVLSPNVEMSVAPSAKDSELVDVTVADHGDERALQTHLSGTVHALRCSRPR
ncbi:MAG: hypothetical protein KC621_09760 [Myxococcales bacterium]|nr:hypothetical protein [Myxococcales bacterium]